MLYPQNMPPQVMALYNRRRLDNDPTVSPLQRRMPQSQASQAQAISDAMNRARVSWQNAGTPQGAQMNPPPAANSQQANGGQMMPQGGAQPSVPQQMPPGAVQAAAPQMAGNAQQYPQYGNVPPQVQALAGFQGQRYGTNQLVR